MRGRDPTSLALPRVMGRARLSEKTLDPGDKIAGSRDFFDFFRFLRFFRFFANFAKNRKNRPTPKKCHFFRISGSDPEIRKKWRFFGGPKIRIFGTLAGSLPDLAPKLRKITPGIPTRPGRDPGTRGFHAVPPQKSGPEFVKKLTKSRRTKVAP